MTYSFCQTSCSEYRDMSCWMRNAAYTANSAMTQVQGLLRAFMRTRPFKLPDQHDYDLSFTQELKSSLPLEEKADD